MKKEIHNMHIYIYKKKTKKAVIYGTVNVSDKSKGNGPL